MKKRGIGADPLLGIVILVLVISGIIFLVSKTLLSLDSNVLACSMNAFLEAYFRDPVYQAEVFKQECPHNQLNIKESDINKEPKIPVGVDLDKIPYWKTYDLTNEENKRKFNLNQKIAKEMTDCWYKGGAGVMPIGGKWWWPLGFKEVDREEDFWPKYLGKVGEKIELWMPDVNAPMFCILCSRIRFDETVAQIYPSGSGYDLDNFLKNVPHGIERDKDQYSAIIDPTYGPSIISPHYEYTTNEPLAVVYGRINVHRLMDITHGVLKVVNKASPFDIFPEDRKSTSEDVILLIPFKDLYGDESCTKVINYE